MEKNFLHLKTDRKRLYLLILGAGLTITVILGFQSFQKQTFDEQYVLLRNDAGEEVYEQQVTARIDGKEISMTIEVPPKNFTEQEAQELLNEAEEELSVVLMAGNDSLSCVTEDLSFADTLCDGLVEVEWTEKCSEYFYSDGGYREDVKLSEPLEQTVSAVLKCENYTRDYETVIVVQPQISSMEQILLQEIKEEETKVTLPEEYDGKKILWKKPFDKTFLYVGILTVVSVIFLEIGSRKDRKKEMAERTEQLEREYAQIISKFTMLLSAGLSIRNAWERIVLLAQDRGMEKTIYEEMRISLRELQKGVSELEVYERFGIRTGTIHYKKLMALFISHKKRGSINLLEAMNTEMIQAWEEQKRKTRQQGEKIAAKLLFPMMGMLAVVFLMILVPAFLSFR